MDDWLHAGLLGEVRTIARGSDCHLVGGAVRDRLLGRPAHDLDLVVAGDDSLALRLAERLPARRIDLGGDRFAAQRLVRREEAGPDSVIDLWDRGDASLDDELARRDLTINAIAIELRDGSWHDPMGGRADLEAGVLRACTSASFRDDPLRVLRLARLAAELEDLAVESETLQLAKESLAALAGVAAERRREEFVRTLGARGFDAGLEIWLALGFYPAVMSERELPPNAGQVARGAIARARSFAPALSGETIDRFALHAAFALNAAAGELDSLVKDGWVSRSEARRVAFVCPARSLPADEAAQRWMLYRASDLWPTALLHAAGWAADLAPAACAARLREILALASEQADAIFNPEPLLRGDEIRRLLDLASGPAIGHFAKRLRRLQVEGALRERREAVDWLLSEHRSSSADSAP